MDAKSKANFINSVASGQVIPCPVCGTQNAPDSKFCISCGSELASSPAAPVENAASAFQTVVEDSSHPEGNVGKYKEPESIFADGLPSWDIVPPQVMVRRR